MVKKEVNICDACNKEIAESSCSFCKKDMCKHCSSYFTIDIYNGMSNPYLDKVGVCKGCYNNVNDVNSDNFPDEFKKEIRNQMIEQLKKIVLVKSFDKKPKVKLAVLGTPVQKHYNSKLSEQIEKLFKQQFQNDKEETNK
jgi:hypothetical protein